MMIDDALHKIEQFRGISLAETIATIEKQLMGATHKDIPTVNTTFQVDKSLIISAAQIKRASAQIDVIIHATGILYALPYLLKPDESIESTSLGAGNSGSDFDLVTNQRIAEFKFIYWQNNSSNAVRQRTFFEDYFKLIRHQSHRAKYFYLLNTDIPLRFLSGTSRLLRILDRNRRLSNEFQELYGNKFQTVGEYYKAHQGEVTFVNLVNIVPGLKQFVGLPTTEDETA